VIFPHELARAPMHVKLHYRRMILDGQTEAFAIMCALQQPPGTKGTDRAFQEGRLDGSWLNDMPVHQANKIVREAQAAGISVSGKQYISGIADKRGHMDPMAWVSDTSDVLKVAKARNLTVQGIVNHEGSERPKPEPKALSNRAIARLTKAAMAKNPDLKKSDARALVVEKHTPSWKKKR
jgi:hypothetical protein